MRSYIYIYYQHLSTMTTKLVISPAALGRHWIQIVALHHVGHGHFALEIPVPAFSCSTGFLVHAAHLQTEGFRTVEAAKKLEV